MIANEMASANRTWKEKVRMERQATDRYEAPELTVLGSLEELTHANFTNSNTDFSFYGLTLTGTS